MCYSPLSDVFWLQNVTWPSAREFFPFELLSVVGLKTQKVCCCPWLVTYSIDQQTGNNAVTFKFNNHNVRGNT